MENFTMYFIDAWGPASPASVCSKKLRSAQLPNSFSFPSRPQCSRSKFATSSTVQFGIMEQQIELQSPSKNQTLINIIRNTMLPFLTIVYNFSFLNALFILLKKWIQCISLQGLARMKFKEKVFVGGIVIGVACVFVIPDSSSCAEIGDTACSISPIIGYVAFGVSGLIAFIKVLKLLRQLCACCLDSFLSGFRGHRRNVPLLRDSYQQNQGQNDQISAGVEEIDGYQEEYQEEYQENYQEDYQEEQEEEQEEEQPQYQLQEPFYYNFEAVRQSFNQKECSICLDEFRVNDIIDRKRCNHKFHEACIRDWLQKNSNCPICRMQIN